MALKIRLRQHGRANRQTYRLVVTDIRNPRDGKYLEMLGWYNPCSTTNDCVCNVERIHFWVGQGAQLTPNAQALLARIAPEAMKALRAKQHAKRTKQASKRRALKKAAPTAQAPKAAPAPTAEAAPKKPRAKKTASK